MVERLFQRVMALLGRGQITLVDDTGLAQVVQVDTGPVGTKGTLGLGTKRLRIAEYGLACNPPIGADAVLVFLNGDRTQGVVIATNHKASRPLNLLEGETMLFNGVRGTSIRMGDAGIVVQANGQPVTVHNAGTVRLETARLEVTGDIIDHCDAQSATVKNLRDAYDAHKHTGVAAGGGTTGTTDHTV